MANIFKSGAFLQQCFSVHPLSLSVKMITLPDKIGIVCVNCKSRHRLTFSTLTCQIVNPKSMKNGEAQSLESCITEHHNALRVMEISIDQKIIQFRCRLCKISFQATISMYETYQP